MVTQTAKVWKFSPTKSLSAYGIPIFIAGFFVAPGLVPPSGVRSNNPAHTNSRFRYNLNTGAVFNVSCSFTYTCDAFTVSFYKDGVVISDGDLEDTILTEAAPSTTQMSIQLEFLNFQPVHDGVYHCSAITSDTNEELSSDLYLYGAGEDCMYVWSGWAMCRWWCSMLWIISVIVKRDSTISEYQLLWLASHICFHNIHIKAICTVPQWAGQWFASAHSM